MVLSGFCPSGRALGRELAGGLSFVFVLFSGLFFAGCMPWAHASVHAPPPSTTAPARHITAVIRRNISAAPDC
jgi:hypothetical protein